MPEFKGRPGSAGQRPTGGDKAVATQKKAYFRRKKVCRFCVEKIDDINYKDMKMLHSFVAERGKIVPRCSTHSWRSAARLSRAAFPASARRTSGGSPTPSRRRATSPCCRSRRSSRSRIMEVILREDIERLGNRGQVVKVADGYARNFLLPKRLAVAATDE